VNKGFATRYNLDKLVYVESAGTALEAIEREKQIKRWARAKKVALIERENPEWKDLSHDWYGDIV
jgi:putative endonuclease